MSNRTSRTSGNITLIQNNELCTLDTCDLSLGQLEYLPSVEGNAIFIGIFCLVLPIQLILGIRYKTWGFMVAMILGNGVEAIGYVARILLHYSIFDKNDFILYLIFLTIAPAFISAGIYICLSRIIMLYAPNLSRFKPNTYTICFCSSDLISLILQGAGGGIAATGTTQDTVDMGTDIMIAGLVFQVVSLVAFVVLCIDFMWRLRKNRGLWNVQNAHIYQSGLFKAFLYAIATATVTIIIRSVFRAVELSDGFTGELANNEVLFMILEPPMISTAVLALTVCHPGVCFQGKWSSAKSDYKNRSQRLQSRDFSDTDTVYKGSGNEDDGMELSVLHQRE